MVMHADGAGTKSSLAYMYWKETGDISVWKGIAIDAIVMNLDDLLCVGITDNILLSSTIGRNKNLVPGEVISAIINGTEEFLQELRDMGIGIYSTGGETADVGDLVRTIIVDSTVVARAKREDIISNHNIKPGNVIVGLASFGKAALGGELALADLQESARISHGSPPGSATMPGRRRGRALRRVRVRGSRARARSRAG